MSQIPISPWAECCITVILGASYIWFCETQPLHLTDLIQPIDELLTSNQKSGLIIDKLLSDSSQIDAVITEYWTLSWLYIYMIFRLNDSASEVQ